MSLGTIIRATANNPTLSSIFNNAAQTCNHTFFWNSMHPNGGGKPHGELMTDIKNSFGSYENFRKEFKEAAVAQFGSGWVWLAQEENGKLNIISCYNGDTPMHRRMTPLYGIDVWEHAYYLDYQNRRADHVKQLWQIIDWEMVESRLNM